MTRPILPALCPTVMALHLPDASRSFLAGAAGALLIVLCYALSIAVFAVITR
ncbi:hypothetical protein [Nonomuraea angiospora]|uniref:hypothetical protein n=1 Tax=Nonomuraea angiospora TaxID=46172 RepID=UPI0029A77E0A|nr:hypothetical protein [Nonomuraea angiospora]MDX3107276.1 hypothetical protein [Nonomuraea angiospora]